MPLLEWTIVRLVVSENDGAVTNSEMEPQGRTIASPSRTRRQSKTLCLEKTTLRLRDYVQTVGLNAETKKDRHRAEGEIFVLTFLLIGLFRFGDKSGPTPNFMILAKSHGFGGVFCHPSCVKKARF